MTKAERDKEFWTDWKRRMGIQVGALLGETIGVPKPKDTDTWNALFDLTRFDAEHNS